MPLLAGLDGAAAQSAATPLRGLRCAAAPLARSLRDAYPPLFSSLRSRKRGPLVCPSLAVGSARTGVAALRSAARASPPSGCCGPTRLRLANGPPYPTAPPPGRLPRPRGKLCFPPCPPNSAGSQPRKWGYMAPPCLSCAPAGAGLDQASAAWNAITCFSCPRMTGVLWGRCHGVTTD